MVDATETALLRAALGGDGDAFSRLAEPHRHALRIHCYRLLGSLHEAEDLVQESFTRAWARLDMLDGRGSFRAWLYAIATHACLDVLRRRPRRFLPPSRASAADPNAPVGPAVLDAPWLEPYPDRLLDLVDPSPTPEVRAISNEAVSLAFLTAIQVLPPRQRAILLLREVLGWTAAEVAELLHASPAAVHSGLQRARSTLRGQGYRTAAEGPVTPTRAEQDLLLRYLRAWQEADLPALVALLRDDAVMSMPPMLEWYAGRNAILAFLAAGVFADARRGRLAFRTARANRQPALALYRFEEADGRYHAFALKVLGVEGGKVTQITGFVDATLFPLFGLPNVVDL